MAMTYLVVPEAPMEDAVQLKAGRKLGESGIRLGVLDNSKSNADHLLALNEALSELEGHDAQAASLVKLRYFGGLTHQETADILGITRRAADRLWALARAWLYRRIAGQ